MVKEHEHFLLGYKFKFHPAVVAEIVKVLLVNACSNTYLVVKGSNLGASICASNFNFFKR